MTIVVVGLNYRTAPVELREKFTLSGCLLQMAFEDLKAYLAPPSKVDEAVVLSTCNRLEVYAAASQPEQAITLITGFLSQLQHIPASDLNAHLYHEVGDAAIHHLMRVVCGLDSMILGEAQILGQVTRAFEDARNADLTGSVLARLFTQAIHTGKRARAETSISQYTTSVSHAAALLMLDKLDQRHDVNVLIIGAGEMAALAAQAFQHIEVNTLGFINRTFTRAEILANAFDGRSFVWDDLSQALMWADAVICATGAPHLVLFRRDIELVLPQREPRPLLLIDIAVPRDIEEAVNELLNVWLYDIDALQAVVDSNLELRKAAIPQVEAIIQQEMARFAEWLHGRQVTPVIKTLREWAQHIADDELAETLSHLGEADERTRQLVSRMAHRMVNRLLHEPTSRLRLQANEGNGQGYAHAVRELFALDTLDAVQCDLGCAVTTHSDLQQNQCNLQCILPYGAEQAR